MKKILFLIVVLVGFVLMGCASSSPSSYCCPNQDYCMASVRSRDGTTVWHVCSRSSCNVVKWRDTNYREGNNACNCK